MSKPDLSRERREELESQVQTEEGWTKYGQIPIGCGELRALLSDSAWRERVERQVREWAKDMDQHMEEMRQNPMDSYREGRADTADYYGYELRAIVDTGRGGNES